MVLRADLELMHERAVRQQAGVKHMSKTDMETLVLSLIVEPNELEFQAAVDSAARFGSLVTPPVHP